MYWKALSALALIAASPAPGQELASSGAWRVSATNTQCMALQSFGTDDDRTTLGLVPAMYAGMVQLVLVHNGRKYEGEQMPLRLQLDDKPPLDTTVLVRETGARVGAVVYRANIGRETISQLEVASRLRFQVGVLDLVLPLPDVRPAALRIRQCMAKLAEAWNALPQHRARLKQPARPTDGIDNFFSYFDYPPDAQELNRGGVSAFALLINERGRVAGCSIFETSGHVELDAKACGVLTARGEFKPAIGADGRPIKSTYVHRIRWEPN